MPKGQKLEAQRADSKDGDGVLGQRQRVSPYPPAFRGDNALLVNEIHAVMTKFQFIVL